MSDDVNVRLLRVEERVSEARGLILGIENQGGLIQRLEKVAERSHALANEVAKLQATVQLQYEAAQQSAERSVGLSNDLAKLQVTVRLQADNIQDIIDFVRKR